MWWLIAFITYLSIAGVVGVVYGRHEIQKKVVNPETERWYTIDGEYDDTPRSGWRLKKHERTEVERVRRIAEQEFWGAFFTGIVWPLYVTVILIGGLHFLSTDLLAGRAIKDARQKDADKKAKAILQAYEKEQKDAFKELED